MTIDLPTGTPAVPKDLGEERRTIRAILAAHQEPILRRSLVQMASTFVPFFGLLAAMYALWDVSPWLSLALTVPTAGLIVRIFIIQHDCGHGAFFRSRRANDWLGRFCGLITMTPYSNWRRQHAQHHAVWNNLDKRSGGVDIYSTCLTVAEYQALSPFGRWWRRVVRHPLVCQVLLPPLVFLLFYRMPFDTPLTWWREKLSVVMTNAGLAVLFTLLVLLLGPWPVAVVQIPVISVAAIIGMWLFSVQHRFEDAQWLRQPEWTAINAALAGSSHLKLPRVLQWFSGNIGFHNIHHLMSRVPNYRLEECHRALMAVVPAEKPLTLKQALAAPTYVLWDEQHARLIRFSDLRRRPQTA